MKPTNKKAVKAKTKMVGADACVAMHTALRKCCDSPATSALYNLIHMVCDIGIKPEMFDLWRLLGTIVVERLNTGLKPEKALQAAVEGLDTRWHAVAHDAGNAEPAHSRSALNAIVCMTRCFSPEDWTGMVAFLDEY